MAEFLVELHVPASDAAHAYAVPDGLRRALDRIGRAGTDVGWRCGVFVPAGSAVLCVLTAPSAGEVLAALDLAGLPGATVRQAHHLGPDDHPRPERRST